jgi:hypothetical protein
MANHRSSQRESDAFSGRFYEEFTSASLGGTLARPAHRLSHAAQGVTSFQGPSISAEVQTQAEKGNARLSRSFEEGVPNRYLLVQTLTLNADRRLSLVEFDESRRA